MGWMSQGSIPVSNKRFFSSPKHSRQALGPTKPPLQVVMGGSFMRVQVLGHEADNSSPTSSKFKNQCNCTSTLPICFHVMYRDGFLFDNGKYGYFMM
jgi:hypothetical protein